MKNKHPLLTVTALFVMGFLVIRDKKVVETKPFTTETVVAVEVKKTKPVVKKPKIRGDVYAFMKRLGKAEGLGSYNTVSKTGYLGLYQFHPKTLRSLGFKMSAEEFLANPNLQDSAMIAYMKMNSRELRGVIRKYSGTTYNGVYITKAGILAGAHLVGSPGVLAFFYPDRYNYKTVDGNGVHVSQYMTKFAGYDLRGL